MCMHRIINNTLNMLSFRAGATNQNIDTTKRANYDQLKNERKKKHTHNSFRWNHCFLHFSEFIFNLHTKFEECRRCRLGLPSSLVFQSNRIYIVWNCLKKHKMLYIVNQKHYKLIPVANRMQYPYA